MEEPNPDVGVDETDPVGFDDELLFSLDIILNVYYNTIGSRALFWSCGVWVLCDRAP